MTNTKQHTGLNYLIIGLITLLLIAGAYWVFSSKSTSNTTNDQASSSVAAQPVQDGIQGKNLIDALQALVNDADIRVEIDNPFMEKCTIPNDFRLGKNIKITLRKLAARFQMELHESAPGEYILLGGTCSN